MISPLPIGLLGQVPGIFPDWLLERARQADIEKAKKEIDRRRRREIGCCPCRRTRGDADCPVCDSPWGYELTGFIPPPEPSPEELREALAKIVESRVEIEGSAPAPRPPNRHERRGAAAIARRKP